MLFLESIFPSVLVIIAIAAGFVALFIYAVREDQREKLERAKYAPESSLEDDNKDESELPLPDVTGAKVIKKQVAVRHLG